VKILHVLTDKNIGGAGRLALNFAAWFIYNRRDYDTLDVVLPYGSALKPEFERLNVAVTEAEHLEKSFDRAAVRGLLEIFKSKGPHIIHTHAALSARVAARRYKMAKIIYTRHSYYDQHTPLPRRIVNRFINDRYADAIIAVSPAVVENLKRLGAPMHKVNVIFNGCLYATVYDLDERAEIRKSLGINKEHFVVSIIARLVRDKDHDTVLSAAKILCDIDKGIRVLIAGEGEEEQRLKERARLEDIHNVQFIGFVKDIERIENITDVMINASVGTEATSIALLEGLSLGIPAVASDFGGNPYVVMDGVNGLLFEKGRSIELANAIIHLKNNRGVYERMSFEAMEVFETRFKIDVMCRNIFSLYENLLKRDSIK
jgi:glycosyltransferase involved in cell wall biosynthesis